MNEKAWALRIVLRSVCLVGLFVSPAAADVVWPAYYMALGLVFTPAVLIGLAVEWPVVKTLTARSWRASVKPTLIMNLVTATFGGFLIAFLGVVWEFTFGQMAQSFTGMGTFNPVTWTATAVIAVLVNAVVEVAVLHRFGVEEWLQPLLWLIAANSASVGVATFFAMQL